MFFCATVREQGFRLRVVTFFLYSINITAVNSVGTSSTVGRDLVVITNMVICVVVIFLVNGISLYVGLELPITVKTVLLLVMGLTVTRCARNTEG